VVEFVEVANQILLLEGVLGLLVAAILVTELLVKTFPLLVVVLAVVLVLLDCVLFLLVSIHAEGLLESERIYLFEDGFESDQRLLEDLVPMFVCKLGYNWH